ncbi:unnamed protein product [Didymodactylos carnosus]|uniref:Kelch domain-containing protein 10 n=1 Tax=Didymodactylos carnosus TaxID=1234261 RepID=A0A813RTU4_9BILA|nr:unnamed protein product [Didymodactylos carnosus]CAF0785882.1 unnamed protein product [Didymodactylos carnosus]CAF3540779.1 unnamed protein product [Didymodactylos carnosus]CAF3569605.1 unnamed protein product [Didymodactylos carnosus]
MGEATSDILRQRMLCSTSDYCNCRVTRSKNLMEFVEIHPANEKQSKPSPRSGHRAVATDSDLWIWGGYFPRAPQDLPQAESSMFRELWRFNFALKRWTCEKTTGDGPTLTLASHAVCLYQQHLMFVFGGTGFPFGEDVSNDLYILDLNVLKWSKIKLSDQPPEQVYGSSMLIKNEYLYILCGTNSVRYNTDVYEIHLPTMKSKKIGTTFDEIEDPVDAGRYRQEAVLYENKILLFGGGGVSGISFSLKIIPEFDLMTHKWSLRRTTPDPIHNYPVDRKFHSVFKISNTRVLLFGGAHFDLDRSRHTLVEKNLWSFDLDRYEWSKLELQMIIPTYFHAAAMNRRGEIWLQGGVLLTDDDHTGEELTREKRITNLFMCHAQPLRLQEIAWTNFLSKINDESLLTKPNVLSSLMIPKNFIERIH